MRLCIFIIPFFFTRAYYGNYRKFSYTSTIIMEAMIQQQPKYTANNGVRSKDIVFAKTRHQQQEEYHHPGNVRFYTIVHSFIEEYKSTLKRSEKIRIAHEIVATVKRYGGRFVTFNTKLEQWEELPSHVARKQVLRALRAAFASTCLRSPSQIFKEQGGATGQKPRHGKTNVEREN